MTRKLKNVTVTLDPKTARWARIEAARRETSVSRLLGELLEREMKEHDTYDRAMQQFFSQEAGVHRADRRPLPSREELHERPRLR